MKRLQKMPMVNTTTYAYEKGFMVDIVLEIKDGKLFGEAYIYHKNYAVKDMMFGMFIEDVQEFINYILPKLDDHCGWYFREYNMDDEDLEE